MTTALRYLPLVIAIVALCVAVANFGPLIRMMARGFPFRWLWSHFAFAGVAVAFALIAIYLALREIP